jgi:hypothetical protein
MNGNVVRNSFCNGTVPDPSIEQRGGGVLARIETKPAFNNVNVIGNDVHRQWVGRSGDWHWSWGRGHSNSSRIGSCKKKLKFDEHFNTEQSNGLATHILQGAWNCERKQ